MQELNMEPLNDINAHIVNIWLHTKDIGKHISNLCMNILKKLVMIVVNSFQIDPMYTDIKENCIVSKLYLASNTIENQRKKSFHWAIFELSLSYLCFV